MVATVKAVPVRASGARETLRPSLEDVRSIIANCDDSLRTVPIWREVMGDLETPVSAYLKVAGDGLGFILESIEQGERLGRYSFIGADPMALLTFGDGALTIQRQGDIETRDAFDPLVALHEVLADYRAERVEGLPRFLGGAVGYLAYEAVRAFEPRVGQAPGTGLGMPDGQFMLVDSLLVFDHLERTIKAVSHVHLDGDLPLEEEYTRAAERVDALVARLQSPVPRLPRGGAPIAVPVADRGRPNTSPEQYRAIVERAKEYITAGDIIQVVLSQRVDVPTAAHPFTVYRAVRRINPSPYMFYLNLEDYQIVGASPEQLVRLEDRTMTNHPIAGTRPRGATPEEDDALAGELVSDAKERAEHIMLVDLGRNDVGRVAEPGSVQVPKLMEVERFSHVMHLVSNVHGTLRDDLSALDALRSCFPAGTVSGAPKVRAMEIIAELETDRRGAYAGAVGYVDFAGGMDTAIALRTMIYHDGVASLQAGGGIVADSTPEGEYAETYHKMRALLRAIELAEELEAVGEPGAAGEGG
ncbi:MAG TPA: anthranilate synthase component I [Thermomicrobiales bacterium]|nr:anthranilate synthase component I [Thermomicrobiales bacterium]